MEGYPRQLDTFNFSDATFYPDLEFKRFGLYWHCFQRGQMSNRDLLNTKRMSGTAWTEVDRQFVCIHCERGHAHLWSPRREDWAGCSPECCLESHSRVATRSWGAGCRRAGRDGPCGAPRTARTGCSRDCCTTEKERERAQSISFRFAVLASVNPDIHF